MRNLLAALVVVLSMFAASVADVFADCQPQAVVTSMASVPCAASTDACRGWRSFRAAHPFPYQTIAVSFDSNGNALVILSEVPPIAAPKEVVELVEAVFEGYSPTVHRLRYPVGYDGWLEDIVLSVAPQHGRTVRVATADDGTIELPHGLANRLQYLSAVLFGSAESFYVDSIDASAHVAMPALNELQVTADDLQRLVSDTSRRWRALASPDAGPVPWSQVKKQTESRVYVDDSSSVVALMIPANTSVSLIRDEFRRFAVSSDYIIGALRPPGGAVILFARNRQIPLSVLPPLRFETVTSLANALGQPLGQSYERQRVLAGKIRSGDLEEWDWAPIYLSPQLQDSEFGTLLNLADQQLKSWSEQGQVRYARFMYPDPDEFPFLIPATDWFATRTNSTSLIFNWNTSGFSTAVDYEGTGRVISAASTTALPVSYITPPSENPQDLKALQEIGVRGSGIGTRYFASVGDPILARVVQNVFLYQILSETKPFKVPSTPASSQTKRSAAVTKILIEETARWLKEATAPGLQRNQELATLVRASGTTIQKLAEMLAAPDLSTRTLVRAISAAELHAETFRRAMTQYETVKPEYLDIKGKRRAEFIARCRELGGTEVKDDDGIICEYKAANGKEASFPTTYDARYEALAAELTALDQAVAEAGKGFLEARATAERLAKELATAQRVSDDLLSRASLADDLDAVLTRVVEATSALPSDSSIQTPSVVLSCNVANKWSVGGHNIDALPWLAKQGSAKGAPVVRSVADRPTVTMPKERLGQSTQIARGVIERADKTIAPNRPLDAALGLPQQRRSGSFLEALQTRLDLPVADSALLKRAEQCHCDVYVERGDGDVAMLVSLGPPPKPQTVFGSSQLAEKLAATKTDQRVLFVGFAEEQASSLSYDAARRAGVAKQNRSALAESIQRARVLFREGVENARAVFKLPTKNKRAIAALHPDSKTVSVDALTELLSQRPAWKQAQVESGTDVPLSLVEVRFPDAKAAELQTIDVRTLDAKGVLVKGKTLSDTAKAAVTALSGTDRAVDAAITRLADQLHKDPRVDEVKFFVRNAGNVTEVRLRRGQEVERLTSEVVIGE